MNFLVLIVVIQSISISTFCTGDALHGTYRLVRIFPLWAL